MKSGIQIRYDKQNDPPKVWVTANNGLFYGRTEVYVSQASIAELIEELAKFPIDQNQIVQFGVRKPDHDYLAITFKMRDSLGQGLATVNLADGFYTGHRSEAEIPVEFELAALDTFRQSLAYALSTGEGDAFLSGAPSNPGTQ